MHFITNSVARYPIIKYVCKMHVVFVELLLGYGIDVEWNLVIRI